MNENQAYDDWCSEVQEHQRTKDENDRLRAALASTLFDVLGILESYRHAGYEFVDDDAMPDDPDRKNAEWVEGMFTDCMKQVKEIAKRLEVVPAPSSRASQAEEDKDTSHG